GFAAHHHCGEQLQRSVCPLPAQRNQLCAGRAHPQIRRRTLHAAPHHGGGEGTTDGPDETVRSHARDYGLREDTQMATSVQRVSQQLTMADLKGKVDPDWCPGCGDFGVLAAVQKALVELRIPTHNVVTISGIGCSSNFPGY